MQHPCAPPDRSAGKQWWRQGPCLQTDQWEQYFTGHSRFEWNIPPRPLFQIRHGSYIPESRLACVRGFLAATRRCRRTWPRAATDGCSHISTMSTMDCSSPPVCKIICLSTAHGAASPRDANRSSYNKYSGRKARTDDDSARLRLAAHLVVRSTLRLQGSSWFGFNRTWNLSWRRRMRLITAPVFFDAVLQPLPALEPN